MLKDKAADDLRAGEALLALRLVDAAASRYYYGLYHAAVHALTRRGLTPDRLRSGATKWDHVTVMHNVFLVRGRRTDHALYAAMRNARTKADYHADSTSGEDLASRVAAVREFVEEATR